MGDTSNRNIEVFVSNDLGADLVVQSATLGASSSWSPGEEAEAGAMLEEFQTVIWSAMTEDEGGTVSGSVTLEGFGEGVVRIDFSNAANGQSSVVVTPNDKVQGQVEEAPSEEMHPRFRVKLQAV